MKNIAEKLPQEIEPCLSLGMAPSLLVAPPSLRKSPFEEAVVLITHHQNDGSMGFFLNRPISITIKDILENEEQDLSLTKKPILFGGPVAKNSGFILYEHELDSPLDAGINISPTLSISPARKLLEEAAKGKLPGRFELMLGYCGWKKNQLAKELTKGGWLLFPFSPDIFFDVPIEERWHFSFKQHGLLPCTFIDVPGGAQA